MGSQEPRKYDFSFTAGAAIIEETTVVAESLIRNKFDWDKTKVDVLGNNLLKKDKEKTSQRFFSLCQQRLSCLDKAEVNMFISCGASEKRLLTLVAVGKAHTLIYDFVSEVLRNKYYSLDHTLLKSDFNTFLRESEDEHPEIIDKSDSTRTKARQVTFHILEQTGLIDNTKMGNIQKPYVSMAVLKLVINDDPKLLRMFLFTEDEIETQIALNHE